MEVVAAKASLAACRPNAEAEATVIIKRRLEVVWQRALALNNSSVSGAKPRINDFELIT
jgi:hypothetical protein